MIELKLTVDNKVVEISIDPNGEITFGGDSDLITSETVDKIVDLLCEGLDENNCLH